MTPTIRFYFDRPKSHYGTGRNEGIVRDSAPGYPVTVVAGVTLWGVFVCMFISSARQ